MKRGILGLMLFAPWPAVIAADKPTATLILGARQGRATPQRQGFVHTGGGNIDVSQPSPDTLVVTMTGVAVAGAHPCKDSCASLNFDFVQCFEIVVDKPHVQRAKLTVDGRVIGLLRSHGKGGLASEGEGRAVVRCGTTEIVDVTLPTHCATAGDNLSLNARSGPQAVFISPGAYSLEQIWNVTASHSQCLFPCKTASAEFAPEPALDPLWISYSEPFKGAVKKDFGFQIVVKVSTEEPISANHP